MLAPGFAQRLLVTLPPPRVSLRPPSSRCVQNAPISQQQYLLLTEKKGHGSITPAWPSDPQQCDAGSCSWRTQDWTTPLLFSDFRTNPSGSGSRTRTEVSGLERFDPVLQIFVESSCQKEICRDLVQVETSVFFWCFPSSQNRFCPSTNPQNSNLVIVSSAASETPSA